MQGHLFPTMSISTWQENEVLPLNHRVPSLLQITYKILLWCVAPSKIKNKYLYLCQRAWFQILGFLTETSTRAF